MTPIRCYKVARSRLVGRGKWVQIKILFFYALFSPRLKFSGEGGYVYYVGPINNRKDQQYYDEFYREQLSGLNFTHVCVRYRFEFLFLINLLSLLINRVFRGKGNEYALSVLFSRKRYADFELRKFCDANTIYLMNEAVFEFQALICQVRERYLGIEFVTFQHATYPENRLPCLDESQVCYYLAQSDKYFLWDSFTGAQYRKSGRCAEIVVKGRPRGFRFKKYTRRDDGSDFRALLLLAGTHGIQSNSQMINSIFDAGLGGSFYFALHPNDTEDNYQPGINTVRLSSDLNDFDLVVSVPSTVVVDVLESRAPLVVIGGDRYFEYGEFRNCGSINDVIEIIDSGARVCCSVPNHELSVEGWDL